MKTYSLSKEIINNQMKKSVCKIILEKGNASGFFLKINDLIGVLITKQKVLKEISSNKVKEIKIKLNGKISLLVLNEDRKILKFLDKNIIMIRIKEYDNLDIEYLRTDEIDESRYSHKKDIYLIHYNKGDEVSYTKNIAEKIDDNYFKIKYFNTSNQGDFCIPILNSDNNKVIGVFIKENSLIFNINKIEQEFSEQYIEYIKIAFIGEQD